MSTSPRVTRALAASFAKSLISERSNRATALVIGLTGDLGAGKTTFIQGFARGLGIRHPITSPTFLLIRNYKLTTRNYKLFYHADAYRTKHPKDFLMLGFKKMLSDPQAIVLIEWAERVKSILPSHMYFVHLTHGAAPHERIILFSSQ